MGNHVHLVMTTPRADLGDGMRDVLARYARRFNQRHGRSGHLFSERYRMVPIGDDGHLLATIRYVARNPVEAGLASKPGDWTWGSYRAIATGAQPHWVSSEVVLSFFHPMVKRARVLLTQFVETGPSDAPQASVVPGVLRSPSVETLVLLLGVNDGCRAAADLGYSHQRIATVLGVSRPAVTKRLARHRPMSPKSPGTSR